MHLGYKETQEGNDDLGKLILNFASSRRKWKDLENY